MKSAVNVLTFLLHFLVVYLFFLTKPGEGDIMLGASHPMELLDDESLRIAVDEGMHRMNLEREGTVTMLVMDIVEASQQVVSGMKYDVVVNIAPSVNCQNTGERLVTYFPSSVCKADESQMQLYHLQVWARPWLQDTPYLLLSLERIVQEEVPDEIENQGSNN